MTNPKVILAAAILAMLGSGTNSAYTWKVNDKINDTKVAATEHNQRIMVLEKKQTQISQDTRLIRDWVLIQKAKEVKSNVN